MDADLGLQQLIDVRVDRELPRLWRCCLCGERGAAGRAQAHTHYMARHYQPLEASA
jgi:hypothetical protein